MRKIKHLVLGFASLLAIGTADVQAQRVGAYYANWTGYVATQAQYSKLTDVYWSFLIPNTDGSFVAWSQWENQRFTKFKADCPATVRKKISIGGDGITSFSNIMTSPQARSTFATNLANFVQTHNIDGVDIDWEYPTSAEAANFATFLADLKSKLNTKSASMGKPLELSIAVFSTASYGTGGITQAVIDAVDYINIMAYDNNQDQNHSTYAWVTGQTVFSFWSGKVAKSKLVMGLPFYGRPANSPANGNGQNIYPFSSVTAANVSNDSEYGYYYNGKTTIANKVKFALQQGMLGVMFWELSQDKTDANSLLTVIDDTKKSTGGTNPDFSANFDFICGKTNYPLALSSAFNSGYTFSWKKNGVTISGANTSSYTATTGGTYEVFTTQTSSKVTKSAKVVLSDTLPNLGVNGEMPLCAGQSVDLDADVNKTTDGLTLSGITYVWKKGNSTVGTSSLLSVNAADNYTVTATDSKGQCVAKTASVQVTNTALKVQGDTVCVGGKAQVKVLSSGGPFTWFDSQSSDLPLGYGSDYTSLAISGATTLWVQNTGGSLNTTFSKKYSESAAVSKAGKPDYSKGDAGTVARLVFDASQTMRIDSISFFYNGDWAESVKDSVTLSIYNSSKVLVASKKQVVYEMSGKNRLFFGLSIPAGQGYQMAITGPPYADGNGNNGVWCDKNPWNEDPKIMNFAYPFTITGGLITVNGTVASNESNFGVLLQNWYAGLYDISVSTGAPCPRVSVDVKTKVCAPPVVKLTSPSKDTTINENAEISLTSQVSLTNTNLVSLEYKIYDDKNVEKAVLYGTGSNNLAVWTAGAKGAYNVTVTVTDDNGNVGTSSKNITVQPAVGIEDLAFSSDVNVAPNPFENNFTLTASEAYADAYNVKLINSLGAVVSSFDVSNTSTLTLGDNLSAGLYVLQVTKGERVLQTRIVKK